MLINQRNRKGETEMYSTKHASTCDIGVYCVVRCVCGPKIQV